MKKASLIAILLIVAAQFSFTSYHVTLRKTVQKSNLSALVESFTTNEFVDVSILVDIPCAEESVPLQGQLHVLNHITINGEHVSVKSHFQPQGISGIGSISGNKYQATGVTQSTFEGSLKNGQFSYTYINNFRIIGQGPANNVLVHETIHTTVNADGSTTSEVLNFSQECM